MGVPDLAGESLTWLQSEVGRNELVSVLQRRPLREDGAAGTDGDGEPLVRIERDRVGALQPRVPAREAGVECPEAAIGAVHVQPETFLPAEVGEVTERVNGAGLHAPGVRRDQEGVVASLTVGRDGG